jgi:hypothetical protein
MHSGKYAVTYVDSVQQNVLSCSATQLHCRAHPATAYHLLDTTYATCVSIHHMFGAPCLDAAGLPSGSARVPEPVHGLNPPALNIQLTGVSLLCCLHAAGLAAGSA